MHFIMKGKRNKNVEFISGLSHQILNNYCTVEANHLVESTVLSLVKNLSNSFLETLVKHYLCTFLERKKNYSSPSGFTVPFLRNKTEL